MCCMNISVAKLHPSNVSNTRYTYLVLLELCSDEIIVILCRRMDVAKVVAIGGNLDTKADVNVLKDDGRMELKILLLLKCGRVKLT